MSINLTSSAKKYIQEHNIRCLFLDIDTIEEGCTAIYSPNLKQISYEKLQKHNTNEIIEIEDLKLAISEEFVSLFGNQKEFNLDIQGFFEKVLIITNVETKTKNICKV